MLAVLAGLLGAPGSSHADVSLFSTIVTNGPASNRVNLVFFSEGYANGAGGNELAQFLVDATNAARDFFAVEPYAEYSNYFNVFAVATNSAHSGSTHLVAENYQAGRTYFNSTYDDSYDFYITIPPNEVDANPNDGQGKIEALLRQFLPHTNNDLSALLVNDPEEGGSDNFGSTAITSIPEMSYILVHETGHTLGKLGDEYSTDYPGYTSVARPNCTTDTNYASLTWKLWVSSNTPIPTIGYSSNLNTVGVYQGAEYHPTGWYRPFFNCCMQSFGGYGFCPVCSEALVLEIYAKDRPIDKVSPAASRVTNISNEPLVFSLDLLQPATHSLNVQWYTNKTAVRGATNTALSLLPAQLGPGAHTVAAVVLDATALVRNDPKRLLAQTNTWTAVVALTKPVVAITNMPAGLTVRSAAFEVRGRSSDKWPVTNVYYSLNGGGWTGAASLNNWTNWFAAVTLVPGTNTIAAYSVDLTGVASVTAAGRVVYVVTNQLGLAVAGLGKVSPNYGNAWLELGKNYAMTASPDAGFVFSNWVVSTNWQGGQSVSRPNLRFAMASNLTLAVNFSEVAKPVVAITNLKAGQLVSARGLEIQGTAKDTWGVTNVWCEAGSNGWQSAWSANGFKNWSATNFTLSIGTNVIHVYAVNRGGVFSSTNSLTVNALATPSASPQAAGSSVSVADMRRTANGLSFNLKITGAATGSVQVSTDLTTWATLAKFSGTNTTIGFSDPAAIGSMPRFYRVAP